MKVVKWILGIFAVLFLGLVLYLTLLFDPNDFKPQIVDAVKNRQGVSWSSVRISTGLFPDSGN